jgi:inner membrane protein
VHIPTHILSGWVIGNAFPLSPRERLACMIAASAADLDGLGIVLGDAAYQRWHHVAFHGLPFCTLAAVALTAWLCRGTLMRRIGVGALLLAIGHVHLAMDYVGSGPGWPIAYLYPFSDFRFVNWQSWELSSWQNQVSALVLLLITIAIAWRARRTPLEVLMPSLDAKLTRRPLPARA